MRILLAIDGSKHSEAAAQALSERPWPPETTIRVLSVVQSARAAAPFFPESQVNYEMATLRLVDAAEKLVMQKAEAIGNSDSSREAGVKAETTVRQGDPRSEIVTEARDWGADLVVLGSHGRTGIKRLVMGSVAEYVVRHAPCSVEVARQREPHDTEQVRPPLPAHPR